MTQRREPTRLMIVIDAGQAAPERLAAALAAAEIASVVVAAPAGGRQLAAAEAAPLVAAARAAGAAALIAADARLARTLKADGVHLSASDAPEGAYAEAREVLGGRAIVGLDVGRSRHDAMTIAEAGADYVGFGVGGAGEAREAAGEHRLELIDWWAEIFEVACVALDVETPEEARELAGAGADFIAVRIAAHLSPAGAGELVRSMAAALAAVPIES